MESPCFRVYENHVFYVSDKKKLEVIDRKNDTYDGQVSLIIYGDKHPYMMDLMLGEKIIGYSDGEWHLFITNFGNYCACNGSVKRIFDIGMKHLDCDELLQLSKQHGQTNHSYMSARLFDLMGAKPEHFKSLRDERFNKILVEQQPKKIQDDMKLFNDSVDKRIATLEAQLMNISNVSEKMDDVIKANKAIADDRLSRLEQNVSQLSDMMFGLNERLIMTEKHGCSIM